MLYCKVLFRTISKYVNVDCNITAYCIIWQNSLYAKKNNKKTQIDWLIDYCQFFTYVHAKTRFTNIFLG